MDNVDNLLNWIYAMVDKYNFEQFDVDKLEDILNAFDLTDEAAELYGDEYDEAE